MSTVWEQLLYASVDRVVDGQERSGWQIQESSPGLNDDEARQLVELIEPRLVPLASLSGFPSVEEIEAAERRLVHRSTPFGSVLVHTAPAGQDTTGRPNTMTHIVLSRPEPTARPLLAADAWRAPWWSTPFGSSQVREATLPAVGSIGPGHDVTFDTAATMVMQLGASAVLTALADAIAAEPRASDPGQGVMAVLAVRSADEAARWIDSLLRTCAPEAARGIDWSLFQRVRGQGDLEELHARGFDIVCVPAGDLSEFPVIPDGCVLIDTARPSNSAPITRFGRFVQAMTTDLTTWVPSLEAVNQVIEQLSDQSGVTFEWAAAMAQACAPGLLDHAYDGDLTLDVNDALIGAQIPAESMSRYLAAVFNERLDGIDLRTPQDWYERFAVLDEALEPTPGTTRLAHKYLKVAVADATWMLGSTSRPAAPVLRRSLAAWSGSPSHRGELQAHIQTACRTLRDAARQTGIASEKPALMDLALVASLQAEGLVVPMEWMTESLEPAAESLGRGSTEISAAEIAELTIPARTVLAELIEPRLAARLRCGDDVSYQPQMGGELVSALLEGVDTSNLAAITLQRELHGIARRADVGNVLRDLAATGAQVWLLPEVLSELAAVLQPRDLSQLETSGIGEWERLAAAVLTRSPLDPDSAQWARRWVGSSPHLQHASSQLVSPRSELEQLALLVAAMTEPLVTGDMSAENAGYLALNLTHIAALAIPDGDTRTSMPRHLARYAGRRAAAVAVLLEAAQRYETGPHEQIPLGTNFFDNIPRWVAESPEKLIAPAEAPFGQLCMEALAALMSSADTEEPSTPTALRWRAGAISGRGGPMPAQTGRLVPETGNEIPPPQRAARRTACLEAAPMILDARVATLPPGQADAVRQEIIETLQLDSKGVSTMEKLLPRLAAAPSARATSIVQKMKKNLMPWQRKEGHNG